MGTDKKKVDLLYEDAFCYELTNMNVRFERQVELDVKYKDAIFKRRFRADLIVEEKVLVENKALTALSPSDEAQLFNYLKTTGLRVGLLFNFGASKLEKIRRIL